MRLVLRSRRESGSVMIEFTFTMLVLIPLFLGAWAFYDSATTTPSSAFLTAVQKMTVYGDPAANPSSATPVVSGLTTNNVNLTVTFDNGAPSTMTVSITNFKVLSYPAPTTLNGKPFVWFPYVGYWTPP